MVDLNTRTLKNKNEETMNIEVIRYFLNNDIAYLTYSLNENDEAGYTKLYAAKIIDHKACIIQNDDEWMLVKEIIKDIVKNNRDGNQLNIIDLDETELDNITLEDARVFKLQGNLVNLLSENKKVALPIDEVEEEIIEEEPVMEEETIVEETLDEPEEIDYETLYREEINKVEVLENKVVDLETQLEQLQAIVRQIKDLVEE